MCRKDKYYYSYFIEEKNPLLGILTLEIKQDLSNCVLSVNFSYFLKMRIRMLITIFIIILNNS